MPVKEKSRIIIHHESTPAQIKEFLDNVGKIKKVGIWVHPLFLPRSYESKKDQKYVKMREDYTKLLKKAKFPIIALVHPDKIKAFKKFINDIPEGPLRKPILVIETRRSKLPHVATPEPRDIGFEGLAKMVAGKAEKVYVFGEEGKFLDRPKPDQYFFDEEYVPEKWANAIKKQLDDPNRKKILVSGCTMITYTHLLDKAKEHGFKVLYLPKKIYQ